MKTCPDCKQTLPNEAFNRDKSRRDGLGVYCRQCNTARHRKWVSENRETVASKNRAWFEANREAVYARTRAWNAKNQETVARLVREYYEKNKAKYKFSRVNGIATLSNCYVKKLMTIRTSLRSADIPQPLVDLKRAHLLMLRELRKEDHEDR